MAHDLHAPTLKIYREILEQLEELKDLYADSSDNENDREVDDEAEAQQDVLDAIVEEAAERGIEEDDALRIYKAIGLLAKKAQES
jgi:DNA-binding transcriptional regulator GbsR (MarR family)